MSRLRSPAASAYLGFAVFGALWGTWGASIPAIRDQAHVSDGQLGTALLFVGAGALPAMLVAGRAVDRHGRRLTGALLATLGAAGLLAASASRDLLSLALSLAVLGACSGAADVAINAAAADAQQRTGRPVISRAHAVFSAGVVASSLTAGVLRAIGAPTVTGFVVLAVAAAASGATLARRTTERPSSPVTDPDVIVRRSAAGLGFSRPLLALGALGALGFAVENGHQSWSSLYLRDVLDAGPLAAASGPAVFAAAVAVTRVATASASLRHPVALVAAGSVTAGLGTLVVGLAPSFAVALVGLSTAAAGTAVLFPALLSVLAARVPHRQRGAATSVVTAVAYLGFLAGPVYVGGWAAAVGLPGAVLALAALTAVLLVTGLVVLPRLHLGSQPVPPLSPAASVEAAAAPAHGHTGGAARSGPGARAPGAQQAEVDSSPPATTW